MFLIVVDDYNYRNISLQCVDGAEKCYSIRPGPKINDGEIEIEDSAKQIQCVTEIMDDMDPAVRAEQYFEDDFL
jgi:hypothetical protein